MLGTTALAGLMGMQTAGAQQSVQLDIITVVPTKVEESATETLGGVSVVGEERLEQLQPSSPSDVFLGMPGVSATSDANPASTAINIRGLQDSGRVAVIVDGARRNFQINGHRNANPVWLEPEMLKEVTVVRGPVSNIYGSGAIGGVVAFETKSASDYLLPGERAAGSVKTGYETNGDGFLTSVTGAAHLTEGLSAIGNFVYRDKDDYEADNGSTVAGTGYEILGGMGKVTARTSAYSELELGWIGDKDDWSESGGEVDAELEQDQFSGKFTYNNPNDPWIDLHLSAYSVNTSLTQERLIDEDIFVGFGLMGPEFVTAEAGSELGYDVLTKGYDVYNTSRFDTGAFRHTLTYGTDRFLDDVDTEDTADIGDVFNPTGERLAYGAFVQDKLKYRQWLEIIGALRYDGYELDATDIRFSDGSVRDVNNESEHLSPRITAGVSPFERTGLHGLQVYGTFAEGYRAPTTSETLIAGIHPVIVVPFSFLPNPELDPEVAQTYEIGANFRRDDLLKPGDALRVKAAWYQNTVEDYIETVPVSSASNPLCPPAPPTALPGTPDCFQYQNIAEAEIEGLELEAIYDAGGYFAGVSASRIRGDNLQTGEPLATIPADQVTLRGGLRLHRRTVTLGGEVQFFAEQDRVPSDVTPTDGYTLLNTFASYAPNEKYRFDLRLNNILDETYRNHLSESLGTIYEQGFNAKIAATVRFGAGGGVQ